MSEKDGTVQDAELEAIMAELEAQSAAYVAAPGAKGVAAAPAVEKDVDGRDESPVPPPSAFTHDDEVVYEEGDVYDGDAAKVEAEPTAASEAKTADSREALATAKVTEVPEGYDGAAIIEAEGEKAFIAMEADKKAATVTQIKASALAAGALKYFIDVAEFNRETGVNEADLDRCMVEQSSLRAFYGAQAAYAEGQHSKMKVRFDVLEAALYDHHRKELAADPTVKVTEKMVESAVKSDPRYLKGKTTVIEAETIASVNKALSISLGDRKDMLVQLGADRREDGKGQLRMLEAKAAGAGSRAFAS